MSKALSFRAKSKMLGQDSVPFKNGYVISPQQSWSRSNRHRCRYRRRGDGAAEQSRWAGIADYWRFRMGLRSHPPLIVWCTTLHGNPSDCLSLSTYHPSWDKRPFITIITPFYTSILEHSVVLFLEMPWKNFQWFLLENCCFPYRNKSPLNLRISKKHLQS